MTTVFLITTACAVALAAGTSVLAWRLLREHERREAARIAALAADIHGDAVPDAAPDAAPSASWDTAPALITVSALVAVTVILMLSDRAAPPAAEVPAAPAGRTSDVPPPAPSSATLELVQLSDVVTRDHLTVRGQVHNPADAPTRTGLAAVVMLVNQQGDVVATGRSALDPMAPGGTSTFTVALVPGTVAARYRVSFQAGAAVVPHIDRRPRAPVSRVTVANAVRPVQGLS